MIAQSQTSVPEESNFLYSSGDPNAPNEDLELRSPFSRREFSDILQECPHALTRELYPLSKTAQCGMQKQLACDAVSQQNQIIVYSSGDPDTEHVTAGNKVQIQCPVLLKRRSH